MRKNKVALTKTELEIMQFFWDASIPMTSSDVVEHFPEWNRTYIFKILNKLIQFGMLSLADTQVLSGKHYLRQFQVSCTKEEYAAKLLKILNVEVESLPRVANALTKEISSEALDKVEKELDAAISEMLDEGMA